LALTNQQIAARIGSLREVVSRAVNPLQQNELIRITGRHVWIEALEVYSNE
jgi:DNA-binding transcriptional regulator LsrR (DeoR family)